MNELVNRIASGAMAGGLALGLLVAPATHAQAPLEKATVAGWTIEATTDPVRGFTDCRAAKANPDGDRLVFLSRPDGSSGVALVSAKLKLPATTDNDLKLDLPRVEPAATKAPAESKPAPSASDAPPAKPARLRGTPLAR